MGDTIKIFLKTVKLLNNEDNNISTLFDFLNLSLF